VKKFLSTLFIGSVLLMRLSTAIDAQQPAPPDKATTKPAAEPASRLPVVPLKVHVVISKYRADKKISSLPYDISVNTNSGPTRLRIGGDVPYPHTRVQKSDAKPEPVSYTFRTVGTSIDCTGFTEEGGRFRLNVSVSDDSIAYADEKDPGGLTDVPRFRAFSTSNTLLLRDGQTTQMTTAADPITGEVMRVDVTLTVVK
jgi:hypothetical protein